MDFDAFIAKYYSDANDVKQKDILRFLKNAEMLMGEKTPKETLKDKKFLCSLFFIRKGANNVSRAHYQKIKNYILSLADYYGIEIKIPSMEEVIEHQDITLLFKDLDSVLDFIDEIGRSQMINYNAYTDLAFVKGVVVLSWYGFKPDDIVLLTKSCLVNDNGTYKVFYPNSSEYIVVSRTAFQTLLSLSTVSQYKGLPSGKVKIFKGNPDLLFRPTIQGIQTIAPQGIIASLYHFNECVPQYKQTLLSFGLLRKNALFVEIYNDKSTIGLKEKIIQHMKCSRALAVGYQRQYLLWVETYYDDAI